MKLFRTVQYTVCTQNALPEHPRTQNVEIE